MLFNEYKIASTQHPTCSWGFPFTKSDHLGQLCSRSFPLLQIQLGILSNEACRSTRITPANLQGGPYIIQLCNKMQKASVIWEAPQIHLAHLGQIRLTSDERIHV